MGGTRYSDASHKLCLDLSKYVNEYNHRLLNEKNLLGLNFELLIETRATPFNLIILDPRGSSTS